MKTSFLSTFAALGMAMGVAMSESDAAPIVVDFGQGGTGYQTGAVLNGTGATITYNRLEVGSLTSSFSGANPGTPSLQDIGGVSTGVTLTKSTDTGSNNNGIGADINSGSLTSTANAIFPDVVGRTFTFTDSTGGLSKSGPITYTFGNLNLNSAYTFELLSARATGGSRPTQFTVAGLNSGTGSVNSAGNTGALVTISDISPALNGTITLTYDRLGTDSAYGYLNGARITEVVPEPVSMGLLGLGGVALLGRRRK